MPPPSTTKPHPSPLSDLIFSAFSLFVFYPKSTPKPLPRLFKSPIMPLNFSTPQSLSDWLRTRLPSDSLAAWGTQPGTKNVHNLWLELTDGETSISDSTPPIRTVQVVVVRVRNKNPQNQNHQNLILIESHQLLSNGDVRTRSRPLSEKMKPGETVEAAVVRAVKEELGSVVEVGDKDNEVVKIVPGSYSRKVEERVSVSYPGLPACYVLHTVDAFVEGLPDGEFCTEEGDEYEKLEEKEGSKLLAVACKKHFWKWVVDS